MTQPYPLTGTLPTPSTRKRLPLRLRSNGLRGAGLGMLLFLLSCAYVPWERRIYQSVGVHGTDTETHLEYHLCSPAETHYGWVFWRPVAPKSIFAVLD